MNGAPITPYVILGLNLVVMVVGALIAWRLKHGERTDTAQWKRIDEQDGRITELETWRRILEDREARAEANEK